MPMIRNGRNMDGTPMTVKQWVLIVGLLFLVGSPMFWMIFSGYLLTVSPQVAGSIGLANIVISVAVLMFAMRWVRKVR